MLTGVGSRVGRIVLVALAAVAVVGGVVGVALGVARVGAGVVTAVAVYVVADLLTEAARQLAGRGGPGGAAEDLVLGIAAVGLGAVVLVGLRRPVRAAPDRP